MDTWPPCAFVHPELKGVEVRIHLQMHDFRDAMTPSEQVYGMPTRYLIHICHDDKVSLSDTGPFENIIHGFPLGTLEHKWVFFTPQLPPAHPLIPHLSPCSCEHVPLGILREPEGLRDAGKRGVGLQNDKFGDEWLELADANLKEVKFIIEDDGIEHIRRMRADRPPMHGAKQRMRYVRCIVVRDVLEGPRGTVPHRP